MNMKSSIFNLQMPEYIPRIKNLSIIDLYAESNPLMGQFGKKFDVYIKENGLARIFDTRMRFLQEQLKDSIRNYLKLPVSITNENTVFGFGSYSILERLAVKLLPRGIMIGEYPQFRFFPMEFCNSGGSYMPITTPDFSFPFDQIKKQLRFNKKLSVLYINNPNNPSGKLVDKPKLEYLIGLAEKNGILTIVDEVYGDLLPCTYSGTSLVNSYENLLVVRSFSKILGLHNARVGYMIANQKWIGRYNQFCNWDEINNIGAMMGTYILRDKKYVSDLKRLSSRMKIKTMKCFQNNGYEVIPGDEDVPIFLIYKKGRNIEEELAKMNIRVKGSSRYRCFIKDFPVDYARVRIPLRDSTLLSLQKRISAFCNSPSL